MAEKLNSDIATNIPYRREFKFLGSTSEDDNTVKSKQKPTANTRDSIYNVCTYETTSTDTEQEDVVCYFQEQCRIARKNIEDRFSRLIKDLETRQERLLKSVDNIEDEFIKWKRNSDQIKNAIISRKVDLEKTNIPKHPGFDKDVTMAIRKFDKRLKEFSNEENEYLNRTVTFNIDESILQLNKTLGTLILDYELNKLDNEIPTTHTPISIAQDNKHIVILTSKELLIYKDDATPLISTRITPPVTSISSQPMPGGVAICRSRIYVSYNNADIIQAYTEKGAYIRVIGKTGEGINEFRWPESMAVSEIKDTILLYVCEVDNNRVQVLENEEYQQFIGYVANKPGSLRQPNFIAISHDTGNIYVLHSGNPCINFYTKSGILQRQFGSLVGNLADMRGLCSITLFKGLIVGASRYGNVYIIDVLNNLTIEVGITRHTGCSEDLSGGTVISMRGDVWVIDASNKRVVQFNIANVYPVFPKYNK